MFDGIIDNKFYVDGFKRLFAAVGGMNEDDREVWLNTPSFDVTDCRSYNINFDNSDQQFAIIKAINWIPTWFAKVHGKKVSISKHKLTVHNGSFVVRCVYTGSVDGACTWADVAISYEFVDDEIYCNYVEFIKNSLDTEQSNTKSQITCWYLKPQIKCKINDDIERVVTSGFEITLEMFEKVLQDGNINCQQLMTDTIVKKVNEFNK